MMKINTLVTDDQKEKVILIIKKQETFFNNIQCDLFKQYFEFEI